MTCRERALAAYAFRKTDIPCVDLMEGTVWPSLKEDFARRYGLTDNEAIQSALGSDFRWSVFKTYFPPDDNAPVVGNYSGARFLANVETEQELRGLLRLDPNRPEIPDYGRFRETHPGKALICCPAWMPAVSGAFRDFGMEQAMCLMYDKPELIAEYARLAGAYALGVIRRCIRAGAAEHCDFLWLGDDFAAGPAMLLSPDLWRALFKEPLRLQIQEARDAGFRVMFHSCGDISAIYEDLIGMGLNAHIGVQTSCPNLAPEKLAATVGGRLVIHGGIDAQTTLVQEDEAGVVAQVRRNLDAFAACGGYVVSNAHHSLADIGAHKIAAMAKGAGRWAET
jgi:hypothetical protein